MGILEAVGLTVFGAIKVAIVIAVAYFVHRELTQRMDQQAGSHYRSQLLMLGMLLLTAVMVLVVLPIDDTLRGQLLSLMGILISAVIALGSTTFVGNVMAGAMLRSIKACGPGDYVYVADYFGRISEMDLLHCEIQTEERDLVTLPNLYMVTNPMKVLRTSGTLVSTSLSLGYDVHRKSVETQLLIAAEKVGLEKPFVHVKELGDYSVVYRVSGMLRDLKKLLSTRSRLRGAVMDQLHGAGIEIVSPTFMNQRQYPGDQTFMPARRWSKDDEAFSETPEDMIFDKASKAESLHELKSRVDAINEKVKDLEKRKKEAEKEEVKNEIQERIDRMCSQAKRWKQLIEAREKKFDKEE